MRFRLTSTIAGLALLLAGIPRASFAARIPLVRRAAVQSAALTLADLLPAAAPAELRSEATKISMGSAPQPPMTRTLYRQQIEFLLSGHKSLAAALAIPPEIQIRRRFHTLTKAEVVQAIDHALAHQGVTRMPDLSRLNFTAPVYVTGADPGLELIRISSDAQQGITSFRLWTAKERHNLPFTVTVPSVVKVPTLVARRTLVAGDLTSGSDFKVEMRAGEHSVAGAPLVAADLTNLATRGIVRAGAPVERDQFQRPVLVEPGTLSTLIVHGPGFNIKTIVVPLEQGVLGQEIRVRNVESHRVLEARVAGQDSLVK